MPICLTFFVSGFKFQVVYRSFQRKLGTCNLKQKKLETKKRASEKTPDAQIYLFFRNYSPYEAAINSS